MIAYCRNQVRPRCRSGGFSLIELMIAMAIGLIMLTAISLLFVRVSNDRQDLERNSRQVENGRYALSLLRDDIRLAGFYAEILPSDVLWTSNAIGGGSLLDPCTGAPSSGVTAANLGWGTTLSGGKTYYQIPVGLQGRNPTALGCLTVANVSRSAAGSDAIVIRRASTTEEAAPASNSNTFGYYVQTSYCKDAIEEPVAIDRLSSGLTLRKTNCSTVSDVRKFLYRVYFISECNDCSGAGDGIPTLKVVDPASNGNTNPVSLVDGIERLQFEYGIDDNGDGIADRYAKAASVAAGEWESVVSVKLWILARNTEPTQGYVDDKTYTLGSLSGAVTLSGSGLSSAATGGYKRHLYSTVVRINNVAGRKE